MTSCKKSNTKNMVNTLTRKYFQIYLAILFALIFGGCSALSPYQQMEYSNDPQLKIFKDEMNTEDAVNVLKIYIKDIPENTWFDNTEYVWADTTGNHLLAHGVTKLANGEVISNQKIQDNTLVNEELISHDSVKQHYKFVKTDTEAVKKKVGRHPLFGRVTGVQVERSQVLSDYYVICTDDNGYYRTKDFYRFLYSERIPFVMQYKDVKKIKLFKYKQYYNPSYEVNLYDESDNTLYWFRIPVKNQGQQEVYKLLAALSILMPHAKEEYNEDNARAYIDPTLSDFKL